MMTLRTRAILALVVAVTTLFLALPTFFKPQVRRSTLWLPDRAINLGLDLQGGIYWLMRIDTETAVQQRMKQTVGALENVRTEENLPIGEAKLGPDSKSVRLCGGTASVVDPLLDERFPNYDRSAAADGCTELTLSSAGLRDVTRVGIEQSLEVLKTRLDIGGVIEPVIAAQGDDRILIQLPGAEDREGLRKIVAGTAFLTFKKVLASEPNEGLLQARYEKGLPADTEIVVEKQQDKVTEALLVPKEPMLTGSMLEDASIDTDRIGQPVVAFTWNGEGTRIFREFTAANIGERMAIIKDGEVISAPVIRAKIGRNGVIEGRFTTAEARTLSVQLRAGALPIPLLIEEERTVGPALGEDSIRYGMIATAAGAIAVIIFMTIYYKSAGAIATAAVILNVFMILAVMGSLNATLTLPGIAGLVLTVGMAVDANVIIYERLREELRGGKSIRNAVQIAFNKSRLTILDANLTTLIAAVVLYLVGRGPVQGFGTTLAIGIFTSVYTALVITRVLIELVLEWKEEALRV
jgi:preprotein translocase subunit SecD